MSRAEIFIAEALKWYGTKESGGDNRGPDVEAFQRSVDQVAAGEPWCMAFIQFVGKRAGGTNLFPSEHCLTVWERSSSSLRRIKPTAGSVAIWKKRGTRQGHAGIVVLEQGVTIVTIEGNTGPGPGIEREGDGVYLKTRLAYRTDTGSMELVGFLWPWIEPPPARVVSPSSLR